LEKVFVALHHLSIGGINFWHTKTFGALEGVAIEMLILFITIFKILVDK
jgi:hypothetical protein